jgi:hypothetical protein
MSDLSPYDGDARTYGLAVAEAMLALRVIAGRHPVCPRCFCELVIDHLEFLAGQLDHKQPLPPAEDTIGETRGNA